MPRQPGHPRRPGRTATSRRSILVTAATVLALTAGCGGGTEEAGSAASSTDTSDALTELTVETSPTYTQAPLAIAGSEEAFAEQGLKLSTVAYDPATSIPLVLQGQAQIGYGGLGAVLQAIAKGIPIVVVAGPAVQGESPEQALTGVVVGEGSDIETMGDLSGRTVALNALKNDAQAFVADRIDSDGGDSSTTEFVAVPFPGMANALSSGQVDAVATVSPIIQGLVAGGDVDLGPFSPPGAPAGIYFASETFVAEDPDAVEAFQLALQDIYAGVNQDRAPVIDAMVDEFGTDRAVAESIPEVQWSVEVERDFIQEEIDVLKKYDLLEGDIDLDEAVIPVP